MSFFSNAPQKRIINTESEKNGVKAEKSALGNAKTSVTSAKDELFWKAERINPITRLKPYGLDYFGELHEKGESKPFYLNSDDLTMQIYVGSTGTGKGVLIGNKVAEAIKRGEGVIIIDPKQDDFLPQICKELLAEQGRSDDFYMAFWSENFGYMGINDDDNYTDIANKLIDCFNLEPSENAGVDYYRKNERILLKKVLKLFFNGGLGEIIEKDLNEITKALISLKDDLEKKEQYEEEAIKNKPNMNLMEKLEKRYFDPHKLEAIEWKKKDIETLESLANSFQELVSSANIHKDFNLDEVLYNKKVLYLKIDMLDVASLKMAKIVIADAIQKARKKLPTTKIRIFADEISFYANSTLAGALATTRGFNLNFTLALQDLAQMPDGLREAILSNCNLKLFYKISDKQTLEYIEKVGGKEIVTTFSKSQDGTMNFRQDTEDILNVTRIRAMPRSGTAIVLAEALNTIKIIDTNFISVSGKFDYTPYRKVKKINYGEVSNTDLKLDSIDELLKRKERFKEVVKGFQKLDNGLETITFDYEEL